MIRKRKKMCTKTKYLQLGVNKSGQRDLKRLSNN